MARLFLALCLFVSALANGAWAQEERDVGLIQGFLEENLSGAGREVRIEGFEGALSSRATIQTLTIADRRGVWLTLRGAALDWNRSALLRGRIEISELTAQSIEVARRPVPEQAAVPAPEAAPLALPDLPVSVDIARFAVARLTLGADILGQDAEFRAAGSSTLNGGRATVVLDVTRTDGQQGNFTLNGRLDQDAATAALTLTLAEGPDGIAANLMGLPGTPALALDLRGDGPLADFALAVRLDTDGQPRLSGTVETVARAPENRPDAPPRRRFNVDIGGDLRPLLQEDYRAFLGPDVRLRAAAETLEDGGVLLERFTLRSAAMLLAGSATMAPNGWPRQVTVTGRVAPEAGQQSVLLALPGDKTRLAGADLKLRFDADQGDSWTLELDARDVTRAGTSIERARMSGQGTLSPTRQALDGTIELAATGIALSDAALARALGERLTGTLAFAVQQGQPLRLSDLALAGAGFTVTGDATIAGLEGQLDLRIDTDATLRADDLSRFDLLAGMPLGGAADLAITGRLLPVSGAFDATVSGTARDLRTGIAQLDPQLDGTTALRLVAERGPEGLKLSTLAIDGAHVDLSAQGTLSSQTGDLTYDIAVGDLGRSLDALPGPARLTGTASRRGARWSVSAKATGPGASTTTVEASVTQTDDGFGPVAGTLDASVGALSAFSKLAQRQLSGALEMSVSGSGDLRDMSFDGTAKATGQQLRAGNPALDQLLAGKTVLTIDAARDAAGVLTLRGFELAAPAVTAQASGQHGPARTALRYDLRLANIGLFVSRLNGPASASGTASSEGGGPIAVDTALTGPGGIDAKVVGAVARDLGSANLSITGVAPLAIANLYIAPTLVDGMARLDLRLDGPLRAEALSGSVTVRNAQVSVPALRNGLTDVSADIALGGGAARVDLGATVASGGRLAVTGQVGLTAPFRADLTTQLAGLRITDPGLYETTADGRIALSGPLTGGAAITGQLDLGPVELRIPSGVATLDGALPGLVHRNEPADVRRTRAFAGLLDRPAKGGETGAGGPVYALDLLISAPARIFVRGRGLDAELGGKLRLTGTTANVVPQGRFDLIRGRLDLLGKRITLTEARAQLQGGFVPWIRAEAETRNNGIQITVVLEGPADAPELTLTSNPDLPDDEILAQLLFDKDLTKLSPLQALQLANAIRTLAGKSGEGLVGKLRSGFGIDDLDFATGEDGAAGVRVGKYLTDNLYSDVTVDTEGNSEVNLNLTITPSLTARGSVGSDGETGIGIYYERDY